MPRVNKKKKVVDDPERDTKLKKFVETRIEKEILDLALSGKSREEIAAQLNMATQEVGAIMQKSATANAEHLAGLRSSFVDLSLLRTERMMQSLFPHVLTCLEKQEQPDLRVLAEIRATIRLQAEILGINNREAQKPSTPNIQNNVFVASMSTSSPLYARSVAQEQEQYFGEATHFKDTTAPHINLLSRPLPGEDTDADS